jgi:hypothetical protein
MSTFMQDLAAVTRPAERGHHAFVDADGVYLGFVQLLFEPGRRIVLHRFWTLKSGQGHGSGILRTLCDLADRHAVEIELRPLPIGRKPYPMTRKQLAAWYTQFGFNGSGRKMVRMPMTPPPVV